MDIFVRYLTSYIFTTMQLKCVYVSRLSYSSDCYINQNSCSPFLCRFVSFYVKKDIYETKFGTTDWEP